jgi:O-antigen/teichoic acid export membrane protein
MLSRKISVVFFIFLGIALGYVVIAPHLFALLFPQYTASVPYTQVLAFGLLFVPSLFFRQALLTHTKKKHLYIAETLIPLSRIILVVTLLPLYGIWGAVIATVGFQIIEFSLLLFLFSRT